MTEPLLGAIEAGGTKFVLALGRSDGSIAARHIIPTRGPDETLAEAAEWFGRSERVAALGIASFGPVELDRSDARWGHLLATPKPGWAGCDIAGHFGRALGVPVGFDTDVNGAALAEYELGAGRGSGSLAYITVGTGIGGGLVADGRVLHGAGHPELGHAFPPRHSADRDFTGTCPHHGDCFEGLASGPGIAARWGAPLSELGADHEAHGIVAFYLAHLCATLACVTAAGTIVLGGGVMQTRGLLDRVASEAAALDAGYTPGAGRRRIVAPALGQDSGIVGALLLAARALAAR